MKLSRIILFLTFTLISAIFISCSFERYLGQDYIRYYEGEKSVLIFFPETIIKTNLKPKQFFLNDSLATYSIDSTSPARSLFLDSIIDSTFIQKIKEVMIRELTKYGFKVYEENDIEQFIALNDSSYVLNLEQLEIEEYIYIGPAYEFVDIYDDSLKIYLNALNVNSWFEMDRNNMPDEKYPVLYSSYYLLDEVTSTGTFYNPEYTIDTMSMDKVYELAEIVGEKYAINFFDYTLNLFIQDGLPEGRLPKKYFHYDHKARSLQTFYSDGFIEMDP